MSKKITKIFAVITAMCLLTCMTSAFAFDAVVTYPGGIVSMPSGKLVTQREAKAIFAKRQECRKNAYTEEAVHYFDGVADVKSSSELDDSEKARLLDGMPDDAENIGFGKTVYFTYIDEETGLEFCVTKDEYAAKKDFGVKSLDKTIYGSQYDTIISGTPQKIRNTFTVSTDSDAVNKYNDSMAVGVYWGGEDSYYSTSYARAKFPNLSTGTTTTINGTYSEGFPNEGVVYEVEGVSQPAYHDHGKLEGRFLVQKNYYGQTFLGDWRGYIAESLTSISWAFTVSATGISVETGLFDDVTEWTAPLLHYTTAN